MWQRIQTLYLFLGFAINGILFLLTFALLSTDVISHKLSLYGIENPEGGTPLFTSNYGVILCVLSMLLSFIIMAMFKKRQVQLKLVRFNLLAQLGFVVFMFMVADSAAIELGLAEGFTLKYGVGTYLSILPLIFIFLATRGIKKDEALVKAADRIR
ncbi:MAG: DUF4293 domain-containing protein [Flavobacteriales bacterium]|nr:DUF4293 domain-containing protein [Flavobacteriales bacterium]